MDSREKITGAGRALASASPSDTVIVAGYFDPLLAVHARRLRELRSDARRLVVMILDPPDPALPLRARAELVAALECVDFVVIGDHPCAGFPVIHEEQADLRRRAGLIERVAERAKVGAR